MPMPGNQKILLQGPEEYPSPAVRGPHHAHDVYDFGGVVIGRGRGRKLATTVVRARFAVRQMGVKQPVQRKEKDRQEKKPRRLHLPLETKQWNRQPGGSLARKKANQKVCDLLL